MAENTEKQGARRGEGTPDQPAKTENPDALKAAGVATPEQNAKLEHTEGGATTRRDALDAGVPMLAGDPSESVGPEDALGIGSKRGDYRNRIRTDANVSVPTENGGAPIKDDDGNTVDFEPRSRLEPQVPRADDIGEVAGVKGGVETA